MTVGLTPTIRELCADGDIVVIFFDAKGTAYDGEPYADTYFWLFEMYDGKVTKVSAMFDSIKLNDSVWRATWQRGRWYRRRRSLASESDQSCDRSFATLSGMTRDGLDPNRAVT
jgi:hypothetical protein